MMNDMFHYGKIGFKLFLLINLHVLQAIRCYYANYVIRHEKSTSDLTT